jgi:signal transduction histidine kinase
MFSPNVISSEYLSRPAFSPAFSLNHPKKLPQHDALELVTDGYLLLDKGYEVTYASNKAELWIGLTLLELLGENCWQFIPDHVSRLLLSHRDEFSDASIAAEARWLHPSFQTCLKLRLAPRAEGWLLSFHEESADWLPALQAVLGKEKKSSPSARTSEPLTKPVSIYRQDVLSATEAERCRIARELHDVLGQYVTALRFGLDNLSHELQQTHTETASVMKLQSMVEQFDQEFHHVALKLRPPMTDRGLKAAVMQYALEWSERCGVRLDIHSSDDQWFGLSPETETSLYRILQEALNNIQKYARARRVSVILERRHGHLQMVIEDDGCGFEVTQAREAGRSIGLASMTERAALAGGVCEIESSLGQGTTIFIRVPLTQEEV